MAQTLTSKQLLCIQIFAVDEINENIDISFKRRG